MGPLLAIDDLCAGYGASEVLAQVALSVDAGEAVALLGRNGAGKTTLIATIMGLTRRVRGRILFAGRDICALAPHARARAGIGWVPQERAVFPSLTVEENLTAVASPGRWTLEEVLRLFPRLVDRRRHFADQLSGGEQQMLAIGRALMLNPRLLLLDEPLEGLAPMVAGDVLQALRQVVAAEGLGVILVEQDARRALAATNRAVILQRGAVVFTGASAVLRDDAAALDAWLGVGAAGAP